MIVDLPKYTEPDPEPVPIKKVPLDPVTRSLERPDACAKPATIGKQGVRVRPMLNQRQPGRPRKKKRDPRDVRFY